ncbi:MAG: class I SAM-dependent methyltransferase [Christensenellales bacterium]
MYQDFARVYDSLMADVDYRGWAEHYLRLLQLAGIADGARVTECACGTGNLTVFLARHYQVTGLDLSQEMLSIAAGKLRAQGLALPLIRQDMQHLQVHRPQDAVLCTCDGVNYLTGDQGLARFFDAAYRALRPGGALVFDVSSLYKLSRVLGDRTLCATEGPHHYIWYNCWQERESILAMQLHFYIRAADGSFDYFCEDQRQRAFSQEELLLALQTAGFQGIRVFGGLSLRAPDEKDERLHLLALRPAN